MANVLYKNKLIYYIKRNKIFDYFIFYVTGQRYRLGFTATGNATARAWFGGLKHYILLY